MARRAQDGALDTVPEREVQALARRLARAAIGPPSARLRRAVSPDERIMAWATARPEFKTALFRFVDVVPACRDSRDLFAHLVEYLDVESSPAVVRGGLHAAANVPGGKRLAAAVARAGVVRMAHRFVGAADPDGAVERAGALWHAGQATTVDVLGEKTVSLADADAYAAKLLALFDALTRAAERWPEARRLEHDPWGRLGRVHVSVKASALAPMLGPTTLDEGIAEATARLESLIARASATGATVHLDAEHDELKDPTLALLRAIGARWGDRVQLGCVVQAYRRDAYADLQALCDWSAHSLDRPLQIRLVKGAYWDTEVVQAAAHDWPSPVWSDKAETDACYEQCTRLLVGRAGAVRPAFASHNARSLAHAIAAVEHAGLPADAVEYQLLHGMAVPLHRALVERELRTRVYLPVGELVPGMAYLVRRLLENTANESFVRMGYGGRADLDELVERPTGNGNAPVRVGVGATFGEPAAEVRRPEVRTRLERAVRAARDVIDVPVLVGGRAHTPDAARTTRTTRDNFVSLDPSDARTVVARAARATPDDAAAALDTATRGVAPWASASFADRAAVVRRAAAIMRRRRDELMALIVAEAGKPVIEADADVCEAIDFCEYYAREAERIGDGVPIMQAPGERNEYTYQPLGVGAVIAPWNFPLAIPCGMTTAALVCGNAVVLKPAEETPATALRLVQILHEAGVPADALALLPGYGDVGAALVAHPHTAFVAFTGSKAVGLEIIARAAQVEPGQRHVKRVVAEMGGKNAIVVDDDADLDEAVPAIVRSAYGYAGQKCSAASRVIVTPGARDTLLARLAGATRIVPVGAAAELRTVCGPLISEEAWERVGRYQERAASEGDVVVAPEEHDIPGDGWFRGPMLVRSAPHDVVAREEVFGPVLAVLDADDFDHALALANDTEYALTAGVFSRSPSRAARAARTLRAGNVYVNRGITGALVGRQPFGGYGLSGAGTKAGGPDYLLQFVHPRVVTENTLRSGFAPETAANPSSDATPDVALRDTNGSSDHRGEPVTSGD